MNFGEFASDFDDPTTVEINPETGARTGTADLLPGTLAEDRGTFSLSGDGALAYNIDTSEQSVLLEDGLNNMSATITYHSTNSGPIAPGGATAVLAGGLDTVGFGGVLTVGANQATGVYNGSFNFVAAYE